MKNGAIFYFLTLAGLTSFWMGCASQSENVTVKNVTVQTKSEFVRMGIPFSIDSVAKNSELRHVFVLDSNALPTLADLDFAAYYRNPIREAGKEELPENAKPVNAEWKDRKSVV